MTDAAEASSTSQAPRPRIVFRQAWRGDEPKLQEDAKAFWQSLDALPKGVNPDYRVRELCAVAYHEDRPIAVSTAAVRPLSILRCDMAFARWLVAPPFRGTEVAWRLAVFTRNILSRWSGNHPEEQVKGMAIIVQGNAYANIRSLPVWPRSDLMLVGYTARGEQVRAVWFDHAEVE